MSTLEGHPPDMQHFWNIFPEYFVHTNKKDPISEVTEHSFLR